MERPTRFEQQRFVGDKRSFVVFDLDRVESPDVEGMVDELIQSERFASFGPDTLAEARNRGYRAHPSAREVVDDG